MWPDATMDVYVCIRIREVAHRRSHRERFSAPLSVHLSLPFSLSLSLLPFQFRFTLLFLLPCIFPSLFSFCQPFPVTFYRVPPLYARTMRFSRYPGTSFDISSLIFPFYPVPIYPSSSFNSFPPAPLHFSSVLIPLLCTFVSLRFFTLTV